ncbi:hypothetical protein [Nocardia suismassiliense]|uniref:hypothetical protein n=1 Tax=Nocardia suismassiliense TaxID=2077092 RepID=UPI00131F4144|nr:hypothetical protein [Nocardia suismassiliense]
MGESVPIDEVAAFEEALKWITALVRSATLEAETDPTKAALRDQYQDRLTLVRARDPEAIRTVLDNDAPAYRAIHRNH